MKYCKTCIHFDNRQGWGSEKEGVCNRLGSNQLLPTDVHFNRFISFHLDHNPQVVFVGEDFGCVHHEVKEEEQK